VLSLIPPESQEAATSAEPPARLLEEVGRKLSILTAGELGPGSPCGQGHSGRGVLRGLRDVGGPRRAYSRAAETGSPVRCDVHVISKFLPRVEEFALAWLRALL